MTKHDTAVVVTSIAKPNRCLRELADGARSHNFSFLYVADTSSPPDFHLEGCEFVSMDAQANLSFSYVECAPTRHYARKNIGYLLAISRGANVIIETDDDNSPTPEFWRTDLQYCTAEKTVVHGQGWYNVYKHFGSDAWPRGFPLECLADETSAFERSVGTHGDVFVRQGLVAGDPDVDAIYRLTRGNNVYFKARPPILLGKGVWCPLNSQNTTWLHPVFPLMYLPSTCSFRATDIVRGYVALRCLWELGASVVFVAPTVDQERNAHDLMRDFQDEWIIYTKASDIARALDTLELSAGADGVNANMKRCYEALATLGVVSESELQGLESWLRDVTLLTH